MCIAKEIVFGKKSGHFWVDILEVNKCKNPSRSVNFRDFRGGFRRFSLQKTAFYVAIASLLQYRNTVFQRAKSRLLEDKKPSFAARKKDRFSNALTVSEFQKCP